MPDYKPDPDHPGQHIDIIELVRRYPDKPPPVNVEGLLRRDLWTRQEALLILCGLAPRNVVHSGLPIGTIGGGIVYLDGIASAQLDALGLQHPRARDWLPEFMTLAGYAAGQDMTERKAPAEWLAWAESKGFTPYWLDDAMTGCTPEPKGVQPAAVAAGATVRHSANGKRTQLLDAEIEAAKREATDPSSAPSVFAVLQRYAEAKRAPFLGFVDGEGCKYRTPDGDVKFLTLAALRKRMTRAANGR